VPKSRFITQGDAIKFRTQASDDDNCLNKLDQNEVTAIRFFRSSGVER
jgi:hypothetical protein